MGLFGWLGSKVWGAAKAVCRAVAEGAKKISQGAAKAWGAFTGKTKFEEAKERWDALLQKADIKRKELQKRHDEISAEVQQYLDCIGESRRRTVDVSFDRFVELAACFAVWDVDAKNVVETFVSSMNVKVSRLKSRADVFTIDFDAHPIKTTVQAVFTLGFLTRKRATESLNQVKEQEIVFRDNVRNAEAGLEQLATVAKSLKRLSGIVADLQGVYEKLLVELEYSVHLLRSHILLTAPVGGTVRKLDCYFLPENHLKCLMACEKMTRIMHGVCKTEILPKQNDDGQQEAERLDKESAAFKKQRNEINAYMAA